MVSFKGAIVLQLNVPVHSTEDTVPSANDCGISVNAIFVLSKRPLDVAEYLLYCHYVALRPWCGATKMCSGPQAPDVRTKYHVFMSMLKGFLPTTTHCASGNTSSPSPSMRPRSNRPNALDTLPTKTDCRTIVFYPRAMRLAVDYIVV